MIRIIPLLEQNISLSKLIKKVNLTKSDIVLGHSRLITDGASDNQPYYLDNITVFHNGIVVNAEQLFQTENIKRKNEIDTEIIAQLLKKYQENNNFNHVKEKILSLCEGIVAVAIALPKFGKLLLFSNNGSLYVGAKGDTKYFSSEEYPLSVIGCHDIEKVKDNIKIIDIPCSTQSQIKIEDKRVERRSLIFKLKENKTKKIFWNSLNQV